MRSIIGRSLEDRHRPDGTRGAAADAQGKPDEAEAAAADEPVEGRQALDVRAAALAAGEMGPEVGLRPGGGVSRRPAALAVSAVAEPVHGLERKAREVVQVSGL